MGHTYLPAAASHSKVQILEKLREHDDALNSLESTGLPTNVFNVKSYNAKGDGSTADTEAIRAADAAAAPTKGAVYFPFGTYMIGEHNTSLKCLVPSDGVSYLGACRAGATLKMIANQRVSCKMIYVGPNVGNLTISKLTLDNDVANQNNSDNEHANPIFLDNASNIHITDMEIKNAPGSSIVVFQNSKDVLIDFCYIHDGFWIGVAMGDPSGQQNCEVRDCRITGTASGFHIESNGAVGPTKGILVERCILDGFTGDAALEIVGGTGSANWCTNITARDLDITGFVQVSSAQNILLDNLYVTNSDPASGNSPNHWAAMRVTGSGNNIVVRGGQIVHTASASAPQAVIIAGNTNNNLTGVRFLDVEVQVQNTASHGYQIQACASCLIRGGKVVGNASMTTGFYGININAKVAPNVGTVRVQGVHIVDFPIGLVCQSAASSIHINVLEVHQCLFEDDTGASLMTAAMSLDLDSRHAVQQASVIGNDCAAAPTTLFATYPNVPMLISGNRCAIGLWSVATAPAFAATTGSEAVARDTGEHYYNMTGASNGWKLVTHA